MDYEYIKVMSVKASVLISHFAFIFFIRLFNLISPLNIALKHYTLLNFAQNARQKQFSSLICELIHNG